MTIWVNHPWCPWTKVLIHAILTGGSPLKTETLSFPHTTIDLLSLIFIPKALSQPLYPTQFHPSPILILIPLHTILSVKSDLRKWIFCNEFLTSSNPNCQNFKKSWSKLLILRSPSKKSNTPKGNAHTNVKDPPDSVQDLIKKRNTHTIQVPQVNGFAVNVLSWTSNFVISVKSATNLNLHSLPHLPAQEEVETSSLALKIGNAISVATWTMPEEMNVTVVNCQKMPANDFCSFESNVDSENLT
jgi:hypothetical protein